MAFRDISDGFFIRFISLAFLFIDSFFADLEIVNDIIKRTFPRKYLMHMAEFGGVKQYRLLTAC